MEDGRVLTETARRVLALSCRGLDIDDVAARLGLSGEAVRAEIDRAVRALGASSKLEAIVIAARLGLIDPSGHV